MKKWIPNFVILSPLVLFASACLVLHADQSPAPKPTAYSYKWNQKMQTLYQSLVRILMDVSSDQYFNSEKNKTQIENHAKKLASLAHDLGKKDIQSPDQDPTVSMLSSLFADEAQHAYNELKRGNRAYARGILRSISGFCVACHTRHASGPEFPKLPNSLRTSSLMPIERAEFFAATRQYDLAQEEFKKIVESPAVLKRLFEWERALHQSLAIAVRVKKDPFQALEIVEKVLANKSAPFSLKQNAIQWKKSILEWKNEGTRKALTQEGLYAEALRLTEQAHNFQKYRLDRSADILYLRASSVIHDLLQLAPNGPHAADAFLMAGLCYEVLKPLNLEDLHEIYYEACIKKVPHSNTSELCYKRYEESVFAGYTGSGGTDLPEDVKSRLSYFESFAHPKAQPESVPTTPSAPLQN